MGNVEWTESDKAMVAKIAGEVVEKVLENCPWRMQYQQDKRFLIGVFIGAGLIGGGGAAAFIQHLVGG